MLVETEEVCRIVGLVLGRRDVTADARLVEDLGAESADVLNITVALEQKYDVSIEEADLGRVSTVRDLEALVRGSRR